VYPPRILNGGGTAPFGVPLCPVLPQPRMTDHRLTWRPSFNSASAHWASIEACPSLPAVHVLLCRRLSCRHADVGKYRRQMDGGGRGDEPNVTTTATRCVEIAAPAFISRRPPPAVACTRRYAGRSMV